MLNDPHSRALVCAVVTFVGAALTLLAGAAIGQTAAPAQLQPADARISDRAIHSDYQTYQAMQVRIKALNDRGVGAGPRVSDYHLSKAQCWLDVSFHEYTRNDRSPFPQAALEQSERLVKLMEDKASPLPNDTPLVNEADYLRKDLWDLSEDLKAHRGLRCGAQKLACAEVELVHAGNEHRQQGWRHAKPYVQIAEDQIIDARRAIETCEQPAPPAAACPPAAPCPPAPEPPAKKPEPVAAAAPLTTKVLFNFDRHTSADIRPATRKTLDQLIAKISSGQQKYQRIELVGHADRLGNAAYNARLAQRRVDTVRDLLVKGGADPAKVSTAARGDTQQVTPCNERFKSAKDLQECLLDNRRVEVQLFE